MTNVHGKPASVAGNEAAAKERILPSVVTTEVTYFAGDPNDPDSFAVEVTWRGYGLYAVKRRSQVWNGKKWEIEPQPSSRTAAFRKRTRFDFDTAERIAWELVATSGGVGS